MSLRLRSLIVKQIAESVNCNASPQLLKQLTSAFELRKTGKEPELHLPVIKTRNLLEKDTASVIKGIVHAKYDDRLIKDVITLDETSRTPKVIFTLHNNAFIKETLTDPRELLNVKKSQIVVEYSSPNIAKPFHVGHLRSTIIGNFIANLYKYLNNNVTRLNYLGDWGTQFGLIAVGVEDAKLTDDDIRNDPIRKLYDAYVSANKKAESDPSIGDRARKYFHDLENGQCADKDRWERFRNYTVDELRQVYDRLGVEFDEYTWESQYSQKDIQNVLSALEDKGLLLEENDGRKIVQVGDRRIPVIKSDKSTLYLARDIACLLDRYKQYNFDKIYYIVDNAQTDHFNALFKITSGVEESLKDKVKHIKFGRIKGMSTRKGTVVFLKDILDEARDIMQKKQIQSTTTKVDVINTDDHTADVLGVSAVIVNDLKQRRQRDYEFDWSKALQVKGDTGIKLQYTHCRLCSLFENVSQSPATIPNPNLLGELEAINLVTEIAKFPEILIRSEEDLEACTLVNYLFVLSNTISRALKRLNVKHEKSKDIQEQRLLLFSCARKVLYDGMKILGLKPLDRM